MMYLTKNTFKIIAFTMLTALIFVTATTQIFAGNGKKNRAQMKKQTTLWKQIDESRVQKRGVQSRLPEKYLVFRLNQSSLKDSLAQLPLQNTDAAQKSPLVMEIPLPDGSIQRFRMEETQVLSPELAAQYPTWKTFVGYGIDDPQAIGRFDWNIQGFHGYIESGKGTALIDPYQKGDTENYLVFYKHEYGRPSDEFSCTIRDKMSSVIDSEHKPNFLPAAPEFAFGATVRQYRIAIATTGEWSRNAAGANATTPQQIRDGALAVVMTTVTRLNGIYIRELASTFQLVNPPTNDDARNIIFDNPSDDPYDNTDNSAQLPINHTTLANRVGLTNFDIGHLYGTGGGGVAQSPSLCDDADKGQGYSARGTNTGDPFVVDYVAHELGHQFRAKHTYNNSDPSGACTTRTADDAFEVASGATIMSYVGICTQRNLQQFVDTGLPSFHIRSMTDINGYVTTSTPATTGCGTAVGTNTVPTVIAGAAFTIPRLTPFTLTATGADADGGDVANLLYSWEEYDKAPSASGALGTPAGTYDVDTDGVLRPLFRVYSPISSNQRTYPSLNFILNPADNEQTVNVNNVSSNQPALTYTGTHPTGAPGAVCDPNTVQPCVIGERLPTVTRTMNFRVSLRDRRGGVVDAGTTVTVASGAGPFQVRTQNPAANFAPSETWQTGTTKTVMWDVAGTDANGINTANVNILLSTDGGQTFPIMLIAGAPNNGTAQITVPNNPTQTARIKVEAVGNIFFDINNVNFAINAPTAAGVTVSGRVTNQRSRAVWGATVRATDQNGNIQVAYTDFAGYYNFDNIAAGQIQVFTVSARGYRFSPQVYSLIGDETINFVAQ